MYPYVLKATYFDTNYEQKQINCLIYAENMSAAAARIERYCDPEDLEIHCVGDEVQLFEVSEEIANALILGGGIFDEGIKILKGD